MLHTNKIKRNYSSKTTCIIKWREFFFYNKNGESIYFVTKTLILLLKTKNRDVNKN